jgi:hypothetical protein
VIGAGVVVCLFAGAAIAHGASVVDAKVFDRTVLCAFDDVVVTIGSAPKTTHQPGLVFADAFHGRCRSPALTRSAARS